MKKALLALFAVSLLLIFGSCDGSLHNTPASYIELEVVNWPNDGEFSWVGAFPLMDWANGDKLFTVEGGAGEYKVDDPADEIIYASQFKFSITDPGTWDRGWYPLTEGNTDDFGAYKNITAFIPMDGGLHTITLDGGTIPMTITVDGSADGQDSTQSY